MRGVGQAVDGSGAKDFWSSPEFFWWSIILVAVLLLGAILIACAQRWRTRLLETPNSPEHDLEHYRVLYEQGDLSREEFERITGVLAHAAAKKTEPPSSSSGPLTPLGPGEPAG